MAHLHFVAAPQVDTAVAARRAAVFDMQLEVLEFASGANVREGLDISKPALLAIQRFAVAGVPLTSQIPSRKATRLLM
jgi:hypothetical protein